MSTPTGYEGVTARIAERLARRRIGYYGPDPGNANLADVSDAEALVQAEIAPLMPYVRHRSSCILSWAVAHSGVHSDPSKYCDCGLADLELARKS
jgi:hypothetical protein